MEGDSLFAIEWINSSNIGTRILPQFRSKNRTKSSVICYSVRNSFFVIFFSQNNLSIHIISIFLVICVCIYLFRVSGPSYRGKPVLLSEEETERFINRELSSYVFNKGTYLAWKMDTPLPKNTRFTIQVGPNIPSAEGPYKDSYVHYSNFSTYPPFMYSNPFSQLCICVCDCLIDYLTEKLLFSGFENHITMNICHPLHSHCISQIQSIFQHLINPSSNGTKHRELSHTLLIKTISQ
jgi:hypothetical protein